VGKEVRWTVKEMRCCCWSYWMLVLLALASIIAVSAGCTLLIQPAPTDSVGIATYNNQMFQVVMSILSTIGTAVGFIGLWLKSNRDRAELARKTEEAAHSVALKAEETSQKIDLVAEQTRRAPARATDVLEQDKP
jgi:hypothetical protein